MEIKLTNINYKYKNASFNSLSSINMIITKPSIIGITGSSGSGKTTLLGIISKVIKPINGNISIQPDKIKMVPQNPLNTFTNKTVIEEITKLTNNKTKVHAIDSLKMVHLKENYLYKNLFDLSTSEQKLITIATVLAANPKIIAFDEPLKGLDTETKKYLIKLMKMMKYRYNKIVIIASNDIEVLNMLCDTVYVLNDGKIVYNKDTYDVLSNEKLMQENKLKCPNTLEFSNLVKKLKKISLGKRNEINDLIKDIYRKAR